ncbi:MAG TPA: TIGR03564 family F420-dependent LLM class oxidoreductase [Acidimicrobiales bacterium]|nr:TIGR03564 family F420-dependent LLM class oxidoreductase [Acidimicrobiales bacterium]
MRIGINGSSSINSLAGTIAGVRQAADDGFATYWLAQIFGTDALTALAVAGREVPGIELGTAVVPVQPRHPQALASQALTVQAATGNRLVLGIGLSHQPVVEGMWGISFDKPVGYLREYLEALVPMLRGEQVSVRGDHVTAVGSVDVRDAAAPPLLIAALGPQMLRLAGSVGAGTITWCTGPRALADHIVPSITAAADAAGHAAPRVVAALPICVTDDPDGARASIGENLAIYGQLPSYRAMLDREGVASPADIAIVGSEAEVEAGLRRLADGGVTDFGAAIMPRTADENEATLDVLRAWGR